MKKILKKAIPIILSVIMLMMAAIPVGVFGVSADDSDLKYEGDFGYYVSKNTASISEYTGSGGDVVVPSTLGGYPVEDIFYNALSRNDKIKSITISEGVKTLGYQDFDHYSSLEQIYIPSSMTSINGFNFLWCKKPEKY